jgi:hypothetical protein
MNDYSKQTHAESVLCGCSTTPSGYDPLGAFPNQILEAHKTFEIYTFLWQKHHDEDNQQQPWAIE